MLTGGSKLRTVVALCGIVAVAGGLVLAFAWAAHWIPGGRLTAAAMTDAVEAANPPGSGDRRAHATGFCVAGRFESSGLAQRISRAAVFAPGAVTPLVGRMSTAGRMVRSMSLLLRVDDGQEWRMALNNTPFFPVATAEGFHALNLANRPIMATGRPDPAAQVEVRDAHPELLVFAEWARSAQQTSGFADTDYHSVNSFRAVNASGAAAYVRWTLQPHDAMAGLQASESMSVTPDSLAGGLRARLMNGPVSWTMNLHVAEDGDPVLDPSRQWPAARQRVVAGQVVLTTVAMDEQCHAINFDPLILPAGLEHSGDSVLAARSAVYAHSFNRRMREAAGQ